MTYAAIAENDISAYDDATGVAYHFPKRYRHLLEPGTRVIYYKGTLRDASLRERRLSDAPHYFGIATVDRVYEDPHSTKGHLFASLADFRPFVRSVPNKVDGQYLENIPEGRESNYWRNGVRPLSRAGYERILSRAELEEEREDGGPARREDGSPTNDLLQGLESDREGAPTMRYATTYERSSRLRRLAIAIHGVSCIACGLNFEVKYGEHGRGFIHVHHLRPISQVGSEHDVDPSTDLAVLCPNCHSMVHRYKDRTLTVEELVALLSAAKG